MEKVYRNFYGAVERSYNIAPDAILIDKTWVEYDSFNLLDTARDYEPVESDPEFTVSYDGSIFKNDEYIFRAV